MQLAAINVSAVVATLMMANIVKKERWTAPVFIGLNVLNCFCVVRRFNTSCV